MFCRMLPSPLPMKRNKKCLILLSDVNFICHANSFHSERQHVDAIKANVCKSLHPSPWQKKKSALWDVNASLLEYVGVGEGEKKFSCCDWEIANFPIKLSSFSLSVSPLIKSESRCHSHFNLLFHFAFRISICLDSESVSPSAFRGKLKWKNIVQDNLLSKCDFPRHRQPDWILGLEKVFLKNWLNFSSFDPEVGQVATKQDSRFVTFLEPWREKMRRKVPPVPVIGSCSWYVTQSCRNLSSLNLLLIKISARYSEHPAFGGNF